MTVQVGQYHLLPLLFDPLVSGQDIRAGSAGQYVLYPRAVDALVVLRYQLPGFVFRVLIGVIGAMHQAAGDAIGLHAQGARLIDGGGIALRGLGYKQRAQHAGDSQQEKGGDDGAESK